MKNTFILFFSISILTLHASEESKTERVPSGIKFGKNGKTIAINSELARRVSDVLTDVDISTPTAQALEKIFGILKEKAKPKMDNVLEQFRASARSQDKEYNDAFEELLNIENPDDATEKEKCQKVIAANPAREQYLKDLFVQQDFDTIGNELRLLGNQFSPEVKQALSKLKISLKVLVD